MLQAIFVLITLASVVLITISCSNNLAKKTQDSIPIVDSKNIPSDSIYSIPATKAAIEQRLIQLNKEPVPSELELGAMCYKVAAPPNRVDYICPKCGNRTLYTEHMAFYVHREIPDLRNNIEKLNKYIDVSLDESKLCKKCNNTHKPAEGNQKVNLIINFKDGSAPRVFENITADDLDLLTAFFAGKVTYISTYGREVPINQRSNRIKQILGIELNK